MVQRSHHVTPTSTPDTVRTHYSRTEYNTHTSTPAQPHTHTLDQVHKRSDPLALIWPTHHTHVVWCKHAIRTTNHTSTTSTYWSQISAHTQIYESSERRRVLRWRIKSRCRSLLVGRPEDSKLRLDKYQLMEKLEPRTNRLQLRLEGCSSLFWAERWSRAAGRSSSLEFFLGFWYGGFLLKK